MKRNIFPVFLFLSLLLTACGGSGDSGDPASKLNGTWEVDYDESIKSTLALQGISDTTPEQLTVMRTALKNALGEGAFLGLDAAKKTISAKMLDEKFEGVPYKVARTKDKTVTIVYEGREDTFEVRDDDSLRVVAGNGVLILKRK